MYCKDVEKQLAFHLALKLNFWIHELYNFMQIPMNKQRNYTGLNHNFYFFLGGGDMKRFRSALHQLLSHPYFLETMEGLLGNCCQVCQFKISKEYRGYFLIPLQAF